jgi:hypothetical protein
MSARPVPARRIELCQRPLPVAPVGNVVRLDVFEPARQAGPRAERRLGVVAAEAERQHQRLARRYIDLRGQRHVAVGRAVVLPGQRAVAVQILPAVADADEPDRARQPRARARQRDAGPVALREQHRIALVAAEPGRVMRAAVHQMRCQQHEQTQGRAVGGLEVDALQHHIALRVGDDPFLDRVVALPAGVAQDEHRHTVLNAGEFGNGVALLLGEVPARRAVGDD